MLLIIAKVLVILSEITETTETLLSNQFRGRYIVWSIWAFGKTTLFILNPGQYAVISDHKLKQEDSLVSENNRERQFCFISCSDDDLMIIMILNSYLYK